MKRECSAVGKTQRALWSWLIRRSRWSQARVEEVLLGDVLGGQPGRGRLGRTEPLGQLDVPVDRVADEVDRGERVPPDVVGQGTQMRDSAVHRPRCRAGPSPARGSPYDGRAAGRAA